MVTPALAADADLLGNPTHFFVQLEPASTLARMAGWGSGDYDYVFPSGVNVGAFDERRPSAASQAGYNWDLGGIVLGAEGDPCPSVASRDGPPAPISRAFSCRRAAVNFLSTIRGRVGLPIDNFMPYVTAGVAFGNVAPPFQQWCHHAVGFAHAHWAGPPVLGAEVAVADGWSPGRRVSLCRPGKKGPSRGDGGRLLGCPHRHPYAHLPPQRRISAGSCCSGSDRRRSGPGLIRSTPWNMQNPRALFRGRRGFFWVRGSLAARPDPRPAENSDASLGGLQATDDATVSLAAM